MVDSTAELAFLNNLLGYQLSAIDEAIHSLEVARETIVTCTSVINKIIGELTGVPVIILPCPDGEYL